MKKILAIISLMIFTSFNSYANESKTTEEKPDYKWTYSSDPDYDGGLIVSNIPSLEICMKLATNKENIFHRGPRPACVNQNTGYIRMLNCFETSNGFVCE